MTEADSISALPLINIPQFKVCLPSFVIIQIQSFLRLQKCFNTLKPPMRESAAPPLPNYEP